MQDPFSKENLPTTWEGLRVLYVTLCPSNLGAGGSMLAGAVLGPVGALAGAVGGAIAGSRAGAAASEGICDVSASEPLLIPIFPTSDSNDSRKSNQGSRFDRKPPMQPLQGISIAAL